jgi:membrane protease subunit (stomatin/prohibitin family)
MARGRMLMLAAGHRMGQQQAQQQMAQAEALKQQGAQEAMAQQQAVQAATPATEDVIGQIEKLSALHTSGALTDEEFAAAKKKLLG